MEAEEIVSRLTREQGKLKSFGVKSLALFGSTARGEAKTGSDVDFVVDFLGPSTFDQYMDLKLFLEDLLGCPVDLVTRKGIRPALAPAIERESRRVA